MVLGIDYLLHFMSLMPFNLMTVHGLGYYTSMEPCAIVLLSGGQDSATCLAIAVNEYADIHCVCFDYGQRHQIEMESSQQLAKLAGATFQCVDLRFMSGLSNSALIHADQPILDAPGELPSTFVPGRNALFLTVAAMIAHQKQSDVIYTGVCQTDFSGYPDCREEFVASQKTTINLAMETDIQIKTPLMHLTKAQTVIKMNELGRLDWYKETHTCYEGTRPACGKCPACHLRLKGFRDANIADPLAYQSIT
jgi:7-cyano-7-deazaguanine synthase